MTLDQLLDHYRRLMNLPDPTAVIAALGTVAANQLPGDPVWTLLVGPPSSGKTEIIDSLSKLAGAVSVSTVTKASLLSGRAGGAGGLLLTHFRAGTGLLLVKDLTTILSEAAGAKTEVLAMLREVFDGHVSRAVGTKDEPLEWAGKIGFIAGVTEEIEQHRAVIGLMGERFVYIPMPTSDREAMTRAAIRNAGRQPELRAALAAKVREFFDGLPSPLMGPVLSPEEADWLCASADLGSLARSPVLRESRNRDIELVPEPEAPARLVGEFSQLWKGLHVIGASAEQARAVIHSATLGGIPKQRRNALLTLLESESGGLRTVQVANRTRTPSATIRRSLEDLAALGVVDSDQGEREAWRADFWAPTDNTRRLWQRLTVA